MCTGGLSWAAPGARQRRGRRWCESIDERRDGRDAHRGSDERPGEPALLLAHPDKPHPPRRGKYFAVSRLRWRERLWLQPWRRRWVSLGHVAGPERLRGEPEAQSVLLFRELTGTMRRVLRYPLHKRGLWAGRGRAGSRAANTRATRRATRPCSRHRCSDAPNSCRSSLAPRANRRTRAWTERALGSTRFLRGPCTFAHRRVQWTAQAPDPPVRYVSNPAVPSATARRCAGSRGDLMSQVP